MSAGVYNFTVYQGDTFAYTLTWKDSAGDPIDLTGYTARMQVRVSAASETSALELTTENGGITLGGVLGTIVLAATATVTAAIVPREYKYDLELITGVTVRKVLAGEFNLLAEVTK